MPTIPFQTAFIDIAGAVGKIKYSSIGRGGGNVAAETNMTLRSKRA